jgi:DNA mismatch repair protein MutL
MAKVHLLPEHLNNQIAAGEVIERPASVVKELGENAIDAGATTVRVALSEGGLSAISIVDDGGGMLREDAVLALSRHATSKLQTFDDLSRLTSFGFRGEALPAIASVSRFSLHTSVPGAQVGTRILQHGGATMEVSDAPPAGGTRIDVHELFFNTPARRKFMRKESTELSHCQEAVARLALAWPEVGFYLESGGRSLLASPPARGDGKERIAHALGHEVFPHLLPVEERRLGIELTGFIASPEYTLPSARGIYVFVNRRYVRDRQVNFAVQRAFAETLPPGRQPVAVLFLTVDPSQVDVNVHPQKLEVRFSDGRGVQEAMHGGITGALERSPWNASSPSSTELGATPTYALAVERFLDRARSGAPFELSIPAAGEAALTPSFGQLRPGINEAPPPGYFSGLKYLGELGQRFWVCEAAGGTLAVIDPRAVKERIHLHRLSKAAQTGALAQQPSLFAATVELAPEAKAALLASEVPAKLGITLEDFGGATVAVKALPSMLGHGQPAELLHALAEVLPPGESAAPRLAPALKVAAAFAARTSPRTHQHEEVRALLDELDGVDFDLAAQHATVVVREIPLLELLASAD